ncbi:helix-turn-helix domain-containing protein [Hydrogenimonas sp.]
MKKLMTPVEFEKEYGVSLSTQAKWRMEKKIPYLKMGRFVRYDVNLLGKWFEELIIEPLP